MLSKETNNDAINFDLILLHLTSLPVGQFLAAGS
jgi:hypothetical protein